MGKISTVLSLGLLLVCHQEPVICFKELFFQVEKLVVNFVLNLGLLHSGPQNGCGRSDWHSGDRRGRRLHQHRRSQWLHPGKQLKIIFYSDLIYFKFFKQIKAENLLVLDALYSFRSSKWNKNFLSVSFLDIKLIIEFRRNKD